MGSTDYTNSDLTISDMVFSRLPFLNKYDDDNVSVVNQFILETMYELEGCFKVGATNPDNIGHEKNYSVLMCSIIADIVTTYLLLIRSSLNSEGTDDNPVQIRFLKRAKAGSAETEWGQLAVKDVPGYALAVDKMVDMYSKSAARKARNLGCILDICTDCTGQNMLYNGVLPILTISDCGCH